MRSSETGITSASRDPTEPDDTMKSPKSPRTKPLNQSQYALSRLWSSPKAVLISARCCSDAKGAIRSTTDPGTCRMSHERKKVASTTTTAPSPNFLNKFPIVFTQTPRKIYFVVPSVTNARNEKGRQLREESPPFF